MSSVLEAFDLTVFKEYDGSNLGTNTAAILVEDPPASGEYYLSFTDPRVDVAADGTDLRVNGVLNSQSQTAGWFELTANLRYGVAPEVVPIKSNVFIIRFESSFDLAPFTFVQPCWRYQDEIGTGWGTNQFRYLGTWYAIGNASNKVQLKIKEAGMGSELVYVNDTVWLERGSTEEFVFEWLCYRHDRAINGSSATKPFGTNLSLLGDSLLGTEYIDRDNLNVGPPGKAMYPIIAMLIGNPGEWKVRSDLDNRKFCTCYVERYGEWAVPTAAGIIMPEGVNSLERLIVHADDGGLPLNPEIWTDTEAGWTAVAEDGDLSAINVAGGDEILVRFKSYNFWDDSSWGPYGVTTGDECKHHPLLVKERPIIYFAGITHPGGAPGHMQRHDAFKMGPDNP